MAASTATNIGLQYAWALGEDGWNTGMDSNLLKLDSLVQPNVIDSTLTTPPGSPTTGDKYIVATGGSGAWNALDAKLVIWSGSAWVSYTAKEGWMTYDQTNNYYLKFNGSAWVQDPFGDRAYAESYVDNQISTAGNNYALKEEWFEDFIVANDTAANWLNTLQSRDTSVNIGIPTSAPIGSISGASNTMGWCVLYNASLGAGSVGFLLRESFSTTNHVPADCKKEVIFGVSIETLPTNTSTTDGVLRYGLFSYTSASTADPVGQSTASAYFQADKDGFWKCFSGKTGVSENTTTAVALAADTYVALNVLIASNGTVTFYINGTLVATHSTGVCNYAQPFTAGYSIYNQGAGTLASSATGVGATAFDYWGTKYTLSATRTNAVFKG